MKSYSRLLCSCRIVLSACALRQGCFSHPRGLAFLPRFVPHFLAICFLTWGLVAPNGALAATSTITSGTHTNLYGNSGDGTAPTDADASGNTLTLGDGTNGLDINNISPTTISGGQAPSHNDGSANSNNNTLNINSGTTFINTGPTYIYGGYVQAGYGTASGNIVNFAGSGKITNVTGGKAALGNTVGNIVTISGGNASITSGVYGGRSVNATGGPGFARNNEVHIGSGYTGTITNDVFGGSAGGTGNADYNSVEIAGGTFNKNLSGWGVIGGISTKGAATGNSVSISGGTFGVEIMGGYAVNGTARGNSVSISGGSFAENVYGGRTQMGLDTTGNTVTLSGGTFSGNIYGGYSNEVYTDVFTGNTLNVMAQGLHIGGDLKNFQYLNFYVPSTAAANTTLLTVAGTADLTNSAGQSSSVNVGIAGGSSPLQVGDKIVLIDAATLTTNSNLNTTANGQGMQGISLLYDFTLSTTPNQLVAQVASIGDNPQTKAISEGRAGGMAFVTQGADLAAGQGMGSALAATSTRGGRGGQGGGAGGQSAVAGFGAMSGGSMRYNTGSHVDVDGYSLLTGIGWRNELPSGGLLLGAFFEAGWGSYNSYNNFNNVATVKGDGDTSYYGGGILARYDLTQGSLAGLYTEASLRAGYASTDFSSNDFGQNGGTHASYDSGAAYYGAHAGLGYVWQLNDAASLDFSTKYLWTHQNSDSVTMLGDSVRFKASDSQRWRNGARFNYTVGTDSGAEFTPYMGAAWEYEFDSEARATVNGRGTDSPSLKGSTGIGELGISFKPVANSAFSADLGVQGYTGMREGVTGSLQLKYEF